MNDDQLPNGRTTPPKRGRGRPKTLDRLKVLDLAMSAYWQEGPTEVSVNAIAERTGVSKPSLYREFGDEDGLSEAILQSYADRVLSRLMAILTSQQGFEATIDALIRYASQDSLSDSGCLFFKMRASQTAFGPRTRTMIEQIETGALDAYRAFLEKCRNRGEWTSDLPVPLAAEYLFSQMGLALTRRARGEDPEEIRAVLELSLSVLWRP